MTKQSEQKERYSDPHHPHQKLFSVLAIVVFLAFCVAVGYFVGRPMLQFVSEPEQFRLWVDGHGFFGRLAFIGMMALQIIIAFIPGEPLEIGAGYAFGFWEGTLLCMIGIILGSSLVFGMTRKWGTRLVALFFPMEKIRSLKFLQDGKRLHTLIFFLFFIPGTPKDLLTYMAGLTPIAFKTYFFISNVARIPSVVTSTIGGNALGEQNYVFAVVTLAVVAVVSIIGLCIYRYITARKAKKAEQDTNPLPTASSALPDEDQDV
ncbi:MAG: TVP38/TMEM64 family protein [Oscillospiraceae bacterium]